MEWLFEGVAGGELKTSANHVVNMVTVVLCDMYAMAWLLDLLSLTSWC